MDRVTTVTGHAIPLDSADVDTDQIIPAKYLKRIERTGYGAFVFESWREDPEFVMNRPQYAGASILLAGANFGCGSSREHAVWAIQQMGVKAVIAPTFADIFRNNSAKMGLLTVALPPADVEHLMRSRPRHAGRGHHRRSRCADRCYARQLVPRLRHRPLRQAHPPPWPRRDRPHAAAGSAHRRLRSRAPALSACDPPLTLSLSKGRTAPTSPRSSSLGASGHARRAGPDESRARAKKSKGERRNSSPHVR